MTGTRDARDEYDALAAEYETRWQAYTDRSVRETFRRAPIGECDALLDVGCGTGALLRGVAKSFPNVRTTGIDVSFGMAAMARRSLNDRRCVAVGDAQVLPFRRDAFDLVVSTSSLHFWPDPRGGLLEIARVLRDGGRLVVTDWCDDFVACRVCDVFLRWRDAAHRRIFSARELRRMIESCGFRVESLDRYKISWIWGLMTVVAVKK